MYSTCCQMEINHHYKTVKTSFTKKKDRKNFVSINNILTKYDCFGVYSFLKSFF